MTNKAKAKMIVNYLNWWDYDTKKQAIKDTLEVLDNEEEWIILDYFKDTPDYEPIKKILNK